MSNKANSIYMAQEKLIGLNPRIFFSLYYIHRKNAMASLKNLKNILRSNKSFLSLQKCTQFGLYSRRYIYLSFPTCLQLFSHIFLLAFFFSLRKMSKDIYLIKTCIQFCWYKWLYLWKDKKLWKHFIFMWFLYKSFCLCLFGISFSFK